MLALSFVQSLLGGASGSLVGFTLGLVGGGGSILAVRPDPRDRHADAAGGRHLARRRHGLRSDHGRQLCRGRAGLRSLLGARAGRKLAASRGLLIRIFTGLILLVAAYTFGRRLHLVG